MSNSYFIVTIARVTINKTVKGLIQAVNLDDFLGVDKRMTKQPLGLSKNAMISQVGFKVE